VIKYNSAGVVQWTFRIQGGIGGSVDVIGSISVDASENIYLAAESSRQNLTFYSTTDAVVKFMPNLLGAYNVWDGYVAKFNSAGVHQWSAFVGALFFIYIL
jgi:hypothetical protein